MAWRKGSPLSVVSTLALRRLITFNFASIVTAFHAFIAVGFPDQEDGHFPGVVDGKNRVQM